MQEYHELSLQFQAETQALGVLQSALEQVSVEEASAEQEARRLDGEVAELELQLRRSADDQPGQVRSSKPFAVQDGYQEAVAEYYRRLSKGK